MREQVARRMRARAALRMAKRAARAVVKTYAANLAAGYDDSVQDEKDFKVVVDKFLADPTEKNLTAARTAWLASRAHYMLTEGARFTDGPIDKDPAEQRGADQFLAARRSLHRLHDLVR